MRNFIRRACGCWALAALRWLAWAWHGLLPRWPPIPVANLVRIEVFTAAP